jgi:predicted lipid-binding transport protein (Tim44 family)
MYVSYVRVYGKVWYGSSGLEICLGASTRRGGTYPVLTVGLGGGVWGGLLGGPPLPLSRRGGDSGVATPFIVTSTIALPALGKSWAMDMDAETVQPSLAQSKLRYIVLEADKDAETFRAERYRKILSELMGEQDYDAAARACRHQPASNNVFMPGVSSANRALALPVVRPIIYIFIFLWHEQLVSD